MFSHLPSLFNIPELKSKTVNGLRYYAIDEHLYPSVTSVLSILTKDSIRAWRDSIGHDVADFESRRAANRGTHFHKICEDYLSNKDISDYKKNVLSYGLFNLVRHEIDRIDNIHGMEKSVFSHNLKLAGRLDCVAEFDDILSIIDFKTANKLKSQEILENHFLQETAYSIMWSEITGEPIEQIVTIVTCENGETQVEIGKPQYYIKKLQEVILEFNISQFVKN